MTHLLTVVAGPASTRLATEVSELLQVQALAYECQRFPDGETQVNLRESVRGRDIYVLQSTSPPIDAGDLPLAVTSVAQRFDATIATSRWPTCVSAANWRTP